MSLAALAVAITRALLLLYPPGFRKDAGAALAADVRRRADDRPGAIWLPRLTASLVINAAGAWRDTASRAHTPGISWLDVKLGVRMLAKSPGLSITAGVGIAIAMVIVVGFFSMRHWYFRPPIPLPDGDRIVALQIWNRQTHRAEPRALYDFTAWRTEVRSVEHLTAFQTVSRNLIAEDGSVERVMVAEMTPSGFTLARVPPLAGRTLVDSDAAPGAAPVLVIGHDVWRDRFGASPRAIGSHVRLGSRVHTIVGVMPKGFGFPVNHHYWTAMAIAPAGYKPLDGPPIFVAGRLAPGFDRDAANAELTVAGDRMASRSPDTHRHLRPEVLHYTYPFAGMNRTSGDDNVLLNVLLSLVLLVVCANVAILVYARTATRIGEIAVRSALGASRGRIVGQLFVESFVLAAAGAGAGLAILRLILEWAARVHRNPEFWRDYSLTAPALLYAAGLTILAAVITGVVPALQATGRRLQINLVHFNYGAAPRLGRTWTALVVTQVALAVAIVPIVVALGWSQIGKFTSTPVMAVDRYLGGILIPESREQLRRVVAGLSARLDAETGIGAHAFVADLPGLEQSRQVDLTQNLPQVSPSRHEVEWASVDADFFATTELTLLAGRPLRAADADAHAPGVVVVNRAFSERLGAGGNVLGRRIRGAVDDPAMADAPKNGWSEIVGVVENADANPIDPALVEPRVYHVLTPDTRVSVLLRLDGIDATAAAARLRAIAAAVDPTLTVETVPIGTVYRSKRVLLNAAVAGIAAAVLSVLLLSAAGISALMSFAVAQRQREIAIRLALGARSGQLLAGVFARALRQIGIGVAAGILLAVVLDASADGEALMGHAIPLLSAMTAVIAAVGLLAAFGPARRGLRIEPSAALKGE